MEYFLDEDNPPGVAVSLDYQCFKDKVAKLCFFYEPQIISALTLKVVGLYTVVYIKYIYGCSQKRSILEGTP